MKNNIILTFVVVFVAFIVSCVTRNPNPTPGHAYIADTASISNAVSSAQGAISATAPLNPYASLMQPIAGAIGVLVTAGSLVVAGVKNKQANKSDAVAQTLAAGVAKAGQPAVAQVLASASDSPHYAAVAEHLNNAS